jgi:hypothetical protein
MMGTWVFWEFFQINGHVQRSDRFSVQTDERIDGLHFLPGVGKFGGVISKFWYIGGYIATTWINQGGKVSFPLFFYYTNSFYLLM